MATYLSDPITLTVALPENAGQNVSYTVTDHNSGEDLYIGSVYATGSEQTFYFNDIVYSINDNYKWFRQPTAGLLRNSPHNTKLYVLFNNTQYEIPQIIHATKVPNKPVKYDLPTSGEERIVSFTEWGTGVTPRIPRISKRFPNMFMAMMIAYPDTLPLSNTTLSLAVFDDFDRKIDTVTTISNWYNGEPCITKFVCDNHFFDTMTTILKDTTKTNLHVGVVGNRMSAYNNCKLCDIDDNPADYYVAWINRFGAWQCQPLCSKYEMKEKVTTNDIITVNNETVPCEKISEYSWTLNTHWLTYSEHDEFESLLSSKYVYLYNTKTNEGHYVTVTDSNWTFKDSVNTNKPFNLTLNLTKSTKQNMYL